jgi:hypothetical protein
MLTNHFDPWLRTIQLLRVATHVVPSRERYSKQVCVCSSCTGRHWTTGCCEHENAQINVIERLTRVTVAVEWSDSTRCNYSEQIWRAGVAARGGACALSGELIRRGEAVYRPNPMRPAPSNANAMILASKIELAFEFRSKDE